VGGIESCLRNHSGNQIVGSGDIFTIDTHNVVFK
jgi:hypothetical protein